MSSRRMGEFNNNTNRKSGSDTISISPVPALLRSIFEIDVRGWKVDFAVSYYQSQYGKLHRPDHELVQVEFVLFAL